MNTETKKDYFAELVDASTVEAIDPTITESLALPGTSLNGTLSGGLHFGSLVVVTGTTGDGKSTYCSNIIAQALRQGYRSLIYSGEMMQGVIVQGLIRIIAGAGNITKMKRSIYDYTTYTVKPEAEKKIRDYMAGKIYLTPKGIKRNEILACIEAAITQAGVRVLLVDNLMTALPANKDIFAAQAELVDALADIAHEYGVIILLVAHPKKPNAKEGGDDINAVSGNQHIVDLADAGLRYSRITEKDSFSPSIYGTPERKVTIFKNRITGRLDRTGVAHGYDPASLRIYEITSGPDWGWDFPGLDLKPEKVTPQFDLTD